MNLQEYAAHVEATRKESLRNAMALMAQASKKEGQ